MIKNILLLFISCWFSLAIFAQPYHITADFNPKNTAPFALLYHITPSGKVNVGGASKRDKNDNYRIPITSDMTPGMYQLVYANPTSKKFINLLLTGKNNISFSLSDNKNLIFKDQPNKLLFSIYTSREKFYDQIDTLFTNGEVQLPFIVKAIEELREKQNEIISQVKEPTTNTLIKALKVDLPTNLEDLKMIKQYLIQHYWSNYDVSSPLVNASPYTKEIMLSYFNYAVTNINIPEEVHPTIDTIMYHIQLGNLQFQKKKITEFWQYLQPKDTKEVALSYLTKHYFLPLAEQLEQRKLIENLHRYLRLSLGEKMPNMELQSPWAPHLPLSIHNLTGSHFYIIAFWNSHCSHCLIEMPKTDSLISKYPKELFTGVAIGLEKEVTKWQEIKKTLPHLMNAIATDVLREMIYEQYDIRQIPNYFVLDRYKNIISKPKSFKELQSELYRLSRKKL